MPKKIIPLTDLQIKNAKPQAKAIKLSDGGGLYLEILPSGGKSWRMKYYFAGQEKRIVFGLWPEISLKSARKHRDEAKTLVAHGVDPAEQRKTKRIIAKLEAIELGNTFETVAREWHGKFISKWTSGHAESIIRRLELNIFPWLGKKPIKDIKAPELLTVLRLIENRGALEMAHRVLQICGQVFRYGVATGMAERDISADLRGALPPAPEKHHPSIIDPKEIAKLLRALDNYQGSLATGCALRLAPLVFVRPGELRHAEWKEFDIDNAEWRIPSEKMKMREKHIVPLARQSLAILDEIMPLTGDGRYVFPSERTTARPISENTVNGALRRLGYSKEEMTGHGFRSMASTLLNEHGWNRDAIERQLAHAERNSIRAAYNFAEFLPERRRMMQGWADYLDALKAGAKITPLFSEANS